MTRTTTGLNLRRMSSLLNGLLAGGLLATLLGACSIGNGPVIATCLDDSSTCISKRKLSLDSMLADTDRTWIARRPNPVVYATGVRLFAWRRTKGKLTCNELKSGIFEAGSARKILAGRVDGASKTRIGQIIALSDDVKSELKKTARGKRCPGG